MLFSQFDFSVLSGGLLAVRKVLAGRFVWALFIRFTTLVVDKALDVVFEKLEIFFFEIGNLFLKL